MALTVTPLRKHVASGIATVIATFQFDTSYPTGGEAIDQAVLDKLQSYTGAYLNAVADILMFDSEELPAGHRVILDRGNSKLKLYTTGTTEAANTSDQSAISIRCRLQFGKAVGR